MAVGESASSGSQQVRIQLSTQHDDLRLPNETGPILVPTTLRRQDLSTLVNDLLETSSRIPFEFYIDGYPLRTSITHFLESHHASTEATLSVEYVRAQLPPQHQASFPHDDWVGAVSVLSLSSPAGNADAVRPGQERILSASYDGCVRVWNQSGQALATSEGATAPDESGNRRLADGRSPQLQAAKFLSPTKLIAGGWRMYLRIWDYEEEDGALGVGSATLRPALDLHGHGMAVNNIAIDHPSQRILSSSDDNTAKLWTSDLDQAPAADTAYLPSNTGGNASSTKRRKLSSSAPISKGPLTTLKSHKGPVKAVSFHPADPTVAYTASSDSTLLTWDLETSRAVATRTPGGPHTILRSLCPLRQLGLVLLGTADRRILLVDPRESAVRSNVGVLAGHQNAVSALDAEPESAYGLCSGSFDGCVRIWDVRAAKDAVEGKAKGSTYKIPRQGFGPKCDRIDGGEGVKVLGLQWDRDVGIVSGGEDRKVQVDKVGRGT